MDQTAIIAKEAVITRDNILAIDTSDLENLRIKVHTKTHGVLDVIGIQAIEAVMLIKPSALENRRLRWIKHAWSLHNLIGHPLMQVCAWFKLYKTAMYIHDVTVPRPIGKKDDRRRQTCSNRH